MELAGMDWAALPDGFILLFVVIIYFALLLLSARTAESGTLRPGRNLARGLGYALSLSVLSTSWTYFGAVGLAIRGGWEFLPNSLGPIIALTLLFPIWRRIAHAARRENVNSVADFISSRYGKSRVLGALIASVSMVGALPYIALQLTALTKATGIVVGSPASHTVAPLIVAVLAALAMIFGATRPSLTQHNRGLTRVVAIESLVKMVALVAVSLLALMVLRRPDVPVTMGDLGHGPDIGSSFLLATFLCTVTMFSLPRVFHVGFVTLNDISDLKIGRQVFPLYMLLWAAAIVPIAVAGKSLGIVDSDMAVLHLPMAMGGAFIVNLAFLGGFSAGAAMVMVEVIALSAMITNELIIPWMTNWKIAIPRDSGIGTLIVTVRRVTIIAILCLAYAYFRLMPADTDLARLGFTSLAASAQLVPALIGSVVWRRGHANGAFWSIAVGMLIWVWGVVSPQLGGPGLPLAWSPMPDPFDVAVVVSLLVNVAIYVGISLRSRPSRLDIIQANAFVRGEDPAMLREPIPLDINVGDLRRLLRHFLGPAAAAQGLADFVRDDGSPIDDNTPVTPMIARIAERMLAGAIGASSARNVIGLALTGRPDQVADVNTMLDEAAQAVQFNRDIVYAALNGIDHGVIVLDGELRILAWNARFLDLFEAPASEVHVGRPLEALIALGVSPAGRAPREMANMMAERLEPMRRREQQSFETRWTNGRTFRVVGRPLTGGDYVTTISDITEVRAAEVRMRSITEELEQRVQQRTAELTRANHALAEANGLAERVVSAQNRFVAAASHDLLQPLHAARLYLATGIAEAPDGTRLHTAMERADLSIQSADRLLNALLNLSRIEIGGYRPDIGPVALDDLLHTLGDEFKPLASAKGLDLHVSCGPHWVASNPDLLRSVMQNLIGNAIRYTPSGRILLCVRPDTGHLRIEVRDSGPGVAEDAKDLIFREFTRLDQSRAIGAGSGLGLAIARRICNALDHHLALRSAPGRGSVFSVRVPIAHPPVIAADESVTGSALAGLRVLCVDDQPDVRQAQTMLLQRWGVMVSEADSAEAALAMAPDFDLLLADLNLGTGMDGGALIRTLLPAIPICVLVTSDVTDEGRRLADDLGVSLLRKPVGAGSLRALLMAAARVRASLLTNA